MRRVLAFLIAPVRAVARVVVAVAAVLTAGTRSQEGVTSGGMAVEDTAKLAEAQAKAGEAQARAAEAQVEAGDGAGDGDAAPVRRFPEDVGSPRSLPDADTCRRIVERMMLIRRFEERAGEM